MEITRSELLTAIDFLKDNYTSPTIIEYIAKKYSAQLNPDKTLQQNFDSLIKYLMQYTGEISPSSMSPRTIKIELQKDFDLPSYMGLWYTAASIPQAFDIDTAWKTAQYQYQLVDDRLVLQANLPILKVTNTGYNKDNSVRAKIIGTAEVLPDFVNTPAALYVSFSTGQPRPANPQPNYLVHSTDYKQYSIVGSYDGSNLYILVRERPVSRYLYEILVKYCLKLGYDVSLLREDYHSIQ